jgi:hypothetical protein
VQVFRVLREHGADIEATDFAGHTPLHYACLDGNVAVVIDLLSPNDSNGATTRGANIEAKDNTADTPLHKACLMGNLAVVKALVSGGANIFARNKNRQFPIRTAVDEGKSEVAKYLYKQCYAAIRRLPLHKLLKNLTWIGVPVSIGCPLLRAALHRNVLGMDDVVEILEYLVGQNPALLSSRDQDGHYHST